METSNFRGHSDPEDANIDKRGKHLEKLLNHFWNIWRDEYVRSLRESHKSSKAKPEIISENDIVLIYDKKQPRQLWKLGRVPELIRSKDGVVRAAKVMTGSAGAILSRPVSQLYPIELRKTKQVS